jgi:hypothetical protein
MGPQLFEMARCLLVGDALREFNVAAGIQAKETEKSFREVMQIVTMHVFLDCAYTRQKQYLYKQLCKPISMMVHEFAARVMEINKVLRFYPLNFDANQKLNKDDLKDILEGAVWNAWTAEMYAQGFDVSEHMYKEFVNKCKQFKLVEQLFKGPRASTLDKLSVEDNKGSKQTSFKKNKFKHENNDKNKKRKTSKWCHLHEVSDHDTNECKLVLDQVKKMWSNW